MTLINVLKCGKVNKEDIKKFQSFKCVAVWRGVGGEIFVSACLCKFVCVGGGGGKVCACVSISYIK